LPSPDIDARVSGAARVADILNKRGGQSNGRSGGGGQADGGWKVARYAMLTVVAVFAGSPVDAARVTFTKTVPPRHKFDAPSNRIALLSLQGRTAECAHPFLRIELTNALKATGAVLEDVSHLKTTVEERRAATPADLYLASEDCVCRSEQRPVGDGTSWYAGACAAKIRLSDAKGRDLGLVTLSGTSAEKTDVVDFGSHISSGKEMMRQLAKMIRPHEMTVVIDTDRKAPGEKEAASLIKKKDFAGARAVWERELAANPSHAAIHFSLAAVTEALGDIDAARKHYEEAVRLGPNEEKHARFKGYFEERTR
jgi:tetratricopeptide (TPR) repeat protein